MAAAIWRNASRLRYFHWCLHARGLSQFRSPLPPSTTIAHSPHVPSLPSLRPLELNSNPWEFMEDTYLIPPQLLMKIKRSHQKPILKGPKTPEALNRAVVLLANPFAVGLFHGGVFCCCLLLELVLSFTTTI